MTYERLMRFEDMIEHEEREEQLQEIFNQGKPDDDT